jgi:hypothetical protein
MDASMLEWHRVDRSPRRTLAVAVVLVTGGATGIGAAFVSRLSDTTSHAIALASAATMFGGVFLAVASAWAGLREDVYLAIRKDALVLHRSREDETVLPWGDIDAIRPAEDGTAVTITTKAGAAHLWTVHRGGVELAARITDLRKKIEHGLVG